ncbi:hypothetical protein RV17_GL001901 [Enterococcus thailandicus]|nr:hypothetical protein RV17_GL001901 [Enterococcus thailandicus]
MNNECFIKEACTNKKRNKKQMVNFQLLNVLLLLKKVHKIYL